MPDPHPLDARRDEFLADAMRAAGAGKADGPGVRDVLAGILEDREEVCTRDAIRIAHAWTVGLPTPREWRRR